jgi:hypothetical protein
LTCLHACTVPHEDYGSLGGTALGDRVTVATKTYGVFQGLGNIAFAYSFSNILIEITVGPYHTKPLSVRWRFS